MRNEGFKIAVNTREYDSERLLFILDIIYYYMSYFALLHVEWFRLDSSDVQHLIEPIVIGLACVYTR